MLEKLICGLDDIVVNKQTGKEARVRYIDNTSENWFIMYTLVEDARKTVTLTENQLKNGWMKGE